MTDIVFVFEVHQPHRLRRNIFWDGKVLYRASKVDLFNYYFDNEVDRDIFKRAARKCYFPSNQIILDVIDRHKHDKKKTKFSFSVSGVFLEQCEMFDKDTLETFKQLASSGGTEFLDQTYYHSIASLYPEKEEFIEQVKLHRQTLRDLLGYSNPQIFENTELLYNNAIAKTVEGMGYKGIYTEGVEKILGEKSPNYIYTPKGAKKIRVLLRNYKLTDDIGFRFSARWWPEWPLTADKYARWLAQTKGEVINIFPDYETFGEHHWPETGIHSFLRNLPDEILKFNHLQMVTPSEVVQKHASAGEIEVPAQTTVSWADIQRDQSGWLGNVMQWAYYTTLRRLEPLIREADDAEFLRLWRDFQTSDHLYYMFTAGGGPGEVHSYFSPYESPMDAFVAAQTLLNDFETRIRLAILTANEPFLFYTGIGKEHYTGTMAWSLKGFIKALDSINIKALEFHLANGDFESWAASSLRDHKLAAEIKALKSEEEGEKLRKALVSVAKRRFTKLSKEALDATQLY